MNASLKNLTIVFGFCLIAMSFGCKIVKVYRFTDNNEIKRIRFARYKEVSTKEYLSSRVAIYRLPEGFIYTNDTNRLKPYINTIIKKCKWACVYSGYILQSQGDTIVNVQFYPARTIRDGWEKTYIKKNEIVHGNYSLGKF